jgi:maltose/maltodextrin transport system substrate-binding protein
MGQGKLAMTIAGPWAWSNLTRSGISFGVAPMPGVNGNCGAITTGRTQIGIEAVVPSRYNRTVRLYQLAPRRPLYHTVLA